MPEYLAPGVFVEETSFRSKSIEGVSTSTTAFVGLTRRGPVAGPNNPPELLTSLGDFERLYGGSGDLIYTVDAGGERTAGGVNHIAHAVRAYFNEGGARLFVARVVPRDGNGDPSGGVAVSRHLHGGQALSAVLSNGARFEARIRGAVGNGTVRFQEVETSTTIADLASATPGTVVIHRPTPAGSGTLFRKIAPEWHNEADATVVPTDTGAFATVAEEPRTAAAVATATDGTLVIHHGAAAGTPPVLLRRVSGAWRDSADAVVAALPTTGTFGEVTESPVAFASLAGIAPGTLVIHRPPGAGALPILFRRMEPAWRNAAETFTGALPSTGTLGILTVNVRMSDTEGHTAAFDGLSYDPAHPGGIALAISSARAAELDLFAFFNPGTANGIQLRTAIVGLGEVNGMRELTLAGGQTPAAQTSRFCSRFPGSGGNGRILFSESATPIRAESLGQLPVGSIVQRTIDGPPVARTRFRRTATGWVDEVAAAAVIAPIPAGTGRLELLTLNATTVDADGYSGTLDGVHYDNAHPRSLRAIFPEEPASRGEQQSQLYWFDGADTLTGFDIRNGILGLPRDRSSGARVLRLLGGTEGLPGDPTHWDDAFSAILAIDDVSIVASPGHTALPPGLNDAVRLALISHAETRGSYRIAVLDVPGDFTPMDAAEYKGAIDSKYAALYYPWVVVPNPEFNPNDINSPTELAMPPSGFVCGIYARSDIERGVWKAPANEVVRSALRFERQVVNGEQELLNPAGVNCLRYFAGRGFRVWGARTTSSDPEWKYVNIRRYFNYLEHSIDRSTQWAVFEPNGERLWANVVETVKSFLYNEWVSGALLGTTQEQAFFVRCDRSTITQNDLDNGRLICLIGVAAIKPAEFVIFRIGQKTADSK